MGAAGSGLGAGPATTAPVAIANLEPWHGQSMVPSATWLHRQPTCVQTALNPLNTPLAGWVTTTFASVKTIPPPTGISEAWPSRVPDRPAAAGLAASAVPPAAAACGLPPAADGEDVMARSGPG